MSARSRRAESHFESDIGPLFPQAVAAIMGFVPTCKSCGNDADELIAVKVAGKTRKLCEDCADRAREEGEVAEQSESVVQQMMGFTGRR